MKYLQFFIGNWCRQTWHLWVNWHLVESFMKCKLLYVWISDGHLSSFIHENREIWMTTITSLVVCFIYCLKTNDKKHSWIHFRQSDFIFESKEGWTSSWIVYTCKSSLTLNRIASIYIHHSHKDSSESCIVW